MEDTGNRQIRYYTRVLAPTTATIQTQQRMNYTVQVQLEEISRLSKLLHTQKLLSERLIRRCMEESAPGIHRFHVQRCIVEPL